MMNLNRNEAAALNSLDPNGRIGTGGLGSQANACCQREMTIGEHLDRRIENVERLLRTLQDLKGVLPGQFLNSGMSRIKALSEPL